MFNFLRSFRNKEHLYNKDIQNATNYINAHWDVLTRTHKNSSDTLFGLPNSYIVPTEQRGDFRFNEQYYWDSYFIAIGLIQSGKNELAEGMLENLFYMFDHFKMVPTANRLYMTSRSQPPFLTSYIMLIYGSNIKTEQWLKKAIKIAKDEYEHVWLSKAHPHWRQVHAGLSRYYDINVLHDLAEAESGWDMTTRFGRKALDFLPIDLNSLLYKYETDFADCAKIFGKDDEAKMWLKRASDRKANISKIMWSNSKNFFFDYNFNKKSQGPVWSLAAFYPMWAGLASKEQAAGLVKNLHRFEHDGGLTTTTKPLIDVGIFGSLKTQWAYPNGWAPLHLIVIEGLEKYGYHEKAQEIARKWLNTNIRWFEKHGEFLEKYNVVDTKKPPLSGVYPTQVGFGWTNAVFSELAKKYISKNDEQ